VSKVKAFLTKEGGASAGGCGLNGVSGFLIETAPKPKGHWEYGYNDWRTDLATVKLSAGCGFTFASFKDTPACKAAYEVLSKRFAIAYQSPVRRNSHHRERAHTGTFYVIFDTKKEKKKDVMVDDYKPGMDLA
jgi:hypothetical protein